jgi:hypothetical protein
MGADWGGGDSNLSIFTCLPRFTGQVNTVVTHKLALLGSELESKAIGFLTIFEKNKYFNLLAPEFYI